MVKNKQYFINKLQEKTGYNIEQCNLINKVLENNSIIGKKNRQKIINDLMLNSFTCDDAENIYDISKKIIINEIKNKLNPFIRNKK